MLPWNVLFKELVKTVYLSCKALLLKRQNLNLLFKIFTESKGTQALSELWWSKMHLVRCVDPNGGVHVPADGLSLPVGMRYIISKIR